MNTILFPCKCGMLFRENANAIDKLVPCPFCGQVMRAPSANKLQRYGTVESWANELEIPLKDMERRLAKQECVQGLCKTEVCDWYSETTVREACAKAQERARKRQPSPVAAAKNKPQPLATPAKKKANGLKKKPLVATAKKKPRALVAAGKKKVKG